MHDAGREGGGREGMEGGGPGGDLGGGSLILRAIVSWFLMQWLMT